MVETQRKRLRRTTVLYWLLLLYIIAALVWWFISLTNQNDTMRDFEISSVRSTIDSMATPGLFMQEMGKISSEHTRNQSKYIGEGIIFFLLILIGAAFVYRSVRKQFALQAQQQNFMMAVTHELKTPISVTRLNLETLQKYTLEPEKQRKIIQMTLDETARLNFLTNNILLASQLEGSGYKSSKEELDLSDLLKDCIIGFKNRFPDRTFRCEIEEDAEIEGDPLLLQMLINNLLENAVKYSPKEAVVEAILRKIKPGIEFQVRDEGSGIPDEEKKKIFSKFYRVGNEATRKTQGTGLGLYICRKIARTHNGEIHVTNNEPRGSRFTVIFKT